jgi:cellulase/cellobiase CelA1
MVAAVASTLLFATPPASAALPSGFPASLFYASEQTKAWAYSEASPPQIKIHREAVKSMIASQPTGIWYSSWASEGPDTIADLVEGEVSRAIDQRKTPVFVPYMLPNRDCANLSSGGAPDSAQWRTWIDQFALGIDTAFGAYPATNVRVKIMLEPDAVALQSGDAGCVDADGNPVTFDVAQRNRDLQYAVVALTNAVCLDRRASSCPWWQSHVQVFLDAGHSAWYGWGDAGITTIANRLTAAGVGNAAGFFTNASNYQPTANEAEFGQKIRLKLQSPHAPYQKVHFVDTSRNGAVIPSGRQADTGWPEWCDPTGARLGAPPTVDTGVPLMTTMWIKPPGETDGCFGGSPTVGTPGRDGRGVPADGYPAGNFSAQLACRLIVGSFTCPDVDYGVAPPPPMGLQITSATTDQITLQWWPSYGACAYQIGYRINGRGSFRAIVAFGSGSGINPWPPSAYYLTGSDIKRGTKVEYAVRSRNCGVTARYSGYYAIVATYDYP